MKTATLLVVTLCATATVYGDFSYTTTRKTQGSASGAPSVTKVYYKGQRMMTDSGLGGGALVEITMESGDFSTNPIPDSVFAIPAGYQKVERK
jgi:hypothetical protein